MAQKVIQTQQCALTSEAANSLSVQRKGQSLFHSMPEYLSLRVKKARDTPINHADHSVREGIRDVNR